MLAYYVHDLNPDIFRFGWLGARWYGFAYLMGFVCAYVVLVRLAREGWLRIPQERVADLVLNCCIFGVLLGGRLGYVLLYDLPRAISNGQTALLWDFSSIDLFGMSIPFWGVLKVWQGGMASHGGVIGVVVTIIIFARRNKCQFINLSDAGCMVVPFGLMFGRIANFINGELYGHFTKVPWGVKFPTEISAPTNNVEAVTPMQIEGMKRAVGEYIAAHAESLTNGEAERFLAQHAEVMKQVTSKVGPVNFNIPEQTTQIKATIGSYCGQHWDQITSSELVRWVQTAPADLRGFVRKEFDAILQPRHPSQLYEAFLEGALLLAICWTIGRLWRKDGMAAGAFLTFYPIMRIIGEQFRVGDRPPAWLAWTHVSNSGVLYSLPMLAIGLAFWGYWIRVGSERKLEVSISKP